jgi:hypothetical protein
VRGWKKELVEAKNPVKLDDEPAVKVTAAKRCAR